MISYAQFDPPQDSVLGTLFFTCKICHYEAVSSEGKKFFYYFVLMMCADLAS